MGYMTFFQFLRRCLQLDAEEHVPQQTVWKHVEETLERERAEKTGQESVFGSESENDGR